MSKAVVFNKVEDREAYLLWQASNPTGFFLNWSKTTKVRKDDKKDKIHRFGHTRCSALRIESSWPMKTWWKVCAEEEATLVSWALGKGTHLGNTRLCKNCFPSADQGIQGGWELGEVGPLPTVSELNHFVREGEKAAITVETRRRCIALVGLLKVRLKSKSSDKRLHCAIVGCGWANPSIEHFRGDVVEIHHRRPLSEAPDEGSEMDVESALDNLVPLCPNCHRLIHAKPNGGTYSLEELSHLILQGGR